MELSLWKCLTEFFNFVHKKAWENAIKKAYNVMRVSRILISHPLDFHALCFQVYVEERKNPHALGLMQVFWFFSFRQALVFSVDVVLMPTSYLYILYSIEHKFWNLQDFDNFDYNLFYCLQPFFVSFCRHLTFWCH